MTTDRIKLGMNFLRYCRLVLGLSLTLFAAPFAFSATNVITGTITTNANWSGTNLLIGTVVITNSSAVTIEPGTQMLMNTGATLLVYGRLQVNGANNAPVLFTRATATATWGRLMFIDSTNSYLRGCTFEYSSSVGDHKDYYATACNPVAYGPRNYHETIVALSCHLDIDGCLFRNLPAAGGEGDAIAIISDHPNPTDTNTWNSASATVRNSQFLDVGQGVHSRYAYVLVEGCTFISHNGDNDDVDLYGESFPVPLVRSNLFLFAHDDFVNPTRCSAIIERNIFIGTNDTDHGIVLRDVCRPIVRNNLMFRCNTGAMAIQNGCDALIANNTIVNCNNAIKLFDHQDRIVPPYCLAAASGKATLYNNIIRTSTPAFNLSGFAWNNLTVHVSYSDVQGGTNNSTRNATAVIINGPGNIDVDPLLANVAATNFHILAGSPAIDAGTNVSLAATNFIVSVPEDFDLNPRPLDGNGDGSARFDMGAFEFFLATADSNGDGIPDGWTRSFGFNPTATNVASSNPDNDPHTTLQEWIADTNPTNALSYFRLSSITAPPAAVSFLSSSNRRYTLLASTNLSASNSFMVVAGQSNMTGNGTTQTLSDPNAASAKFYRVEVRMP
jgi:hypothetical protein